MNRPNYKRSLNVLTGVELTPAQKKGLEQHFKTTSSLTFEQYVEHLTKKK